MTGFQVEISDGHADLLGRLRTTCGIESDEAMVVEALTFMAWAATEAAEGNELAAIDTEARVMRVVRCPPLDAAAGVRPGAA